MKQIIECVPNFSEGRDMAVIKQITDVIESVEGIKLLDVDPGAATNRTVVTFVGEPEPVCTFEGTFTAQDTLCADAAKWQIDNRFTAGAVVTYDLRFDELAQVQGMQNIIGGTLKSETADIIVPLPKADSTSYLRPSVYNAELTLHTVCKRDTVIPLSFTVLYPSFVLFQRWNDVIAVANSTYNGGYDITAVSWFRNDTLVQGRGSHNAWYEEKGEFAYSATDTSSVAYHAALTRADDGKTFCTCPVTPVPAREDGQQDQQQPARGRINVSAVTESTAPLTERPSAL